MEEHLSRAEARRFRSARSEAQAPRAAPKPGAFAFLARLARASAKEHGFGDRLQ
jgi:hypothetical protein